MFEDLIGDGLWRRSRGLRRTGNGRRVTGRKPLGSATGKRNLSVVSMSVFEAKVVLPPARKVIQ